MAQSNSERILEAILALPLQERLRLVERVIHQIAEQPAAQASGSDVIGLFEDEAELMDEVVDSAMKARERDPLRQ